MYHWFTTDEEEVADMVFKRDINGITRFLQCHTATGFGIELRSCESTEIAVSIANVGDGKLKITRPAMAEDFADEFECAFLGPFDRLG
jgi:hypothetical protein